MSFYEGGPLATEGTTKWTWTSWPTIPTVLTYNKHVQSSAVYYYIYARHCGVTLGSIHIRAPPIPPLEHECSRAHVWVGSMWLLYPVSAALAPSTPPTHTYSNLSSNADSQHTLLVLSCICIIMFTIIYINYQPITVRMCSCASVYKQTAVIEVVMNGEMLCCCKS